MTTWFYVLTTQNSTGLIDILFLSLSDWDNNLNFVSLIFQYYDEVLQLRLHRMVPKRKTHWQAGKEQKGPF